MKKTPMKTLVTLISLAFAANIAVAADIPAKKPTTSPIPLAAPPLGAKTQSATQKAGAQKMEPKKETTTTKK